MHTNTKLPVNQTQQSPAQQNQAPPNPKTLPLALDFPPKDISKLGKEGKYDVITNALIDARDPILIEGCLSTLIRHEQWDDIAIALERSKNDYTTALCIAALTKEDKLDLIARALRQTELPDVVDACVPLLLKMGRKDLLMQAYAATNNAETKIEIERKMKEMELAAAPLE